MDELLKLFGLTLEEAQKMISANHNEQSALLRGKFRAKARMTHPDKGRHSMMR